MAPTIIRQCVMMAQGPWRGSEGRPGPQQPEQLLSGDRAWGHRGGGRGGGALSTFPQSPRVREQSRASVSSPQRTALPRATCQALRWPLTRHLCEPLSGFTVPLPCGAICVRIRRKPLTLSSPYQGSSLCPTVNWLAQQLSFPG